MQSFRYEIWQDHEKSKRLSLNDKLEKISHLKHERVIDSSLLGRGDTVFAFISHGLSSVVIS